MRWLLPEYVEDILPAEAMRMERLRRRILDLFFKHDYELVMPPLLEYMDSLLTGTGHDLELRTFKVVDQFSGRMMGVRADITPQVARRAIRVQDLFDPQRFAEKLRELLDFHNFVLESYYKQPRIDYQKTLDETLALAPRLAPLIADVPRALYHANRAGKNLLFEGAQGSLLDIDHGTYPFVTSSNCVAGAAAAGAGIGPMHLHYVLGITKAYTTRVGGGPFPTELSDDMGERLRQRGQEFGATTGRPRRTGWFDAAALKRSIQLNGCSGLCITKLDVLDGVEAVKICVGYELEGEFSEILPVGAEELERCHPVYEELPGWMESTVGIKSYERLPKAAQAYLQRIEALAGVPIDLISTGPEREETIVRRHPFDPA